MLLARARPQPPRPALIARLNDGLAAGRPPTLIAAPAIGPELTPVLAAGQLPPPDVLSATILNDLAAPDDQRTTVGRYVLSRGSAPLTSWLNPETTPLASYACTT